MGIFDDAKNKAKDFLNSEEAERRSDELLDKAEQLATDKLGADKSEQIRKVRDAVDERIGTEGAQDAEGTQGAGENPAN